MKNLYKYLLTIVLTMTMILSSADICAMVTYAEEDANSGYVGENEKDISDVGGEQQEATLLDENVMNVDLEDSVQLMDSGTLMDSSVLKKNTGYEEPVSLKPTTEMLNEAVKIDFGDNPKEVLEEELEISSYEDEAAINGVSKDYWEQFSSKYYYNQLNTKQKVLWDALDDVCEIYMTTTECVDGYGDSYHTQPIDMSSTGLTNEETTQVILLYVYANPQYYFLSNSYYGYANYASIGVYSEFANGDERSSMTRQFKSRIDAYMRDVDLVTAGYSGVELVLEREKEINDLLCDEITYVLGAKFNQSAVSAIIYHETVCAGYAKSISMLFNAYGIETVTVASSSGGSGHAWNEANVGGAWYVVDATWADQESYILRDAYNTTNENLNQSFNDYKYHVVSNYKDYCKDIAPVCENDMSSAYKNRYASPTIESVISGGNLVSTINNRYGFLKYGTYSGTYSPKNVVTTDLASGNTVSVSADGNSYINAQSVSTSSSIESSRVVTAGTYKVVYDKNGSDTGSTTSVIYSVGSDVTIPNGIFLSMGNANTGWNTMAEGTGYHIDAGKECGALSFIPGDVVTIFVEWPVASETFYTVVFDTNGGEALAPENQKKIVTYGSVYGILPTPTRSGYDFTGWYTAASGGTKVLSSTTVTTKANHTLYAHWVEKERLLLEGICYQIKDNQIDIGTAYTTNASAVYFKWLAFDLDKQQWSQISDWSTGNWSSWKPQKGNYWLQVQAKTESGLEESYTICFAANKDYSAEVVTLDGFCYIYQSDRIDIGTAYTSNVSDVQFCWMTYNLDTLQWTTISDWSTGNWVSWRPSAGNYWVVVQAKMPNGTMVQNVLCFAVDKNYGPQLDLEGICYIYRGDRIDVGVAYDTSESDVQFKWLAFDLDKQQWSQISDWSTGNWSSWKPQKGNYWLQVQAKTESGLESNYTICFSTDKNY